MSHGLPEMNQPEVARAFDVGATFDTPPLATELGSDIDITRVHPDRFDPESNRQRYMLIVLGQVARVQGAEVLDWDVTRTLAYHAKDAAVRKNDTPIWTEYIVRLTVNTDDGFEERVLPYESKQLQEQEALAGYAMKAIESRAWTNYLLGQDHGLPTEIIYGPNAHDTSYAAYAGHRSYEATVKKETIEAEAA